MLNTYVLAFLSKTEPWKDLTLVISSFRTLKARARALVPSMTFYERSVLKKMSSEELEVFNGEVINLNFGSFMVFLTQDRSLLTFG
jgi:hypothetical protein